MEKSICKGAGKEKHVYSIDIYVKNINNKKNL